jgi:hypothetical protein
MLNTFLPLLSSAAPHSLPAAFGGTSATSPKHLTGFGPSRELMAPLTVTPEPAPAETTPAPSPTPTATTTAAPSAPQTVVLDGEQFTGITTGLVLVVLLLAALLIAQLRRP